jgi:hypothetical protein
MPEIERLSNDEVEKLLPMSLEEENIESFTQILKYFLLSKETYKRVLASLNPETRDEKDKFADSFFGLDPKTRRAFFKTKIEESQDTGHIQFCDIIGGVLANKRRGFSSRSDYITHMNNLLLTSFSNVNDFYYYICDYRNYKSNSIVVGKQKRKLFKFLLDNQLISKEIMVKLSQTKVGTDVYLCISRNPIDYLFCSTGQSFQSCQDTRYALNGLGSLILDPNRVIIFVTQEKAVPYTLKEQFHYFRYIQRSWALIMDNDTVVAIRNYPTKKVQFDTLLKTLGFKATDIKNKRPDTRLSKFSFDMPRYFTNTPSFIYLDYIGLSLNKGTISEVVYDRDYGSTGNVSPNLAGLDFFTMDTKDINIIKYQQMVSAAAGYVCSNCGKLAAIAQGAELFEKRNRKGNRVYICKSCFKADNAAVCGICGYYYPRDQIKYYEKVITQHGDTGIEVCETCAATFVTCGKCERVFSESVKVSIVSGMCAVCEFNESISELPQRKQKEEIKIETEKVEKKEDTYDWTVVETSANYGIDEGEVSIRHQLPHFDEIAIDEFIDPPTRRRNNG